MNLQLSDILLFNKDLNSLLHKKLLINTINAHCWNIAQHDPLYAKALFSSDVLLPDGISIVLAIRILKQRRLKKIAGSDLFYYEMKRLNNTRGKCFFLGSSPHTLKLITDKANKEFPNVKIKSYSPPYVSKFSSGENKNILAVINKFKPDVLFIGMTAPKQEKWAYENYEKLDAGHICSIGAVFDFFAGNIKRAPLWMINLGLEWLYRLLKEPRRLWRRYVFGNIIFIRHILKEKIRLLKE